MPRLLVVVPLAGALALAACPEPTQYGGPIAVAPGLEGRLGLMPGATRPPAPVSATPPATPARVHVMRLGEALGGPSATGRPGDLVLENDQVVFVIDQLGSSLGFAESGGNVVDAADARVRQDELGQVFSYFGAFPRQAVYDSLTSGVDASGAAWVEAKGRELYEKDLLVTTRYVLAAPDRALLITTRLTNSGDRAQGKLSLGDAIQWGGAEKFAPDRGLGFKGDSSGAYVAGIGRTLSYGLTSTDGTIDAVSGGSWSNTVQTRDVTLAPKASVDYARIFVVGVRGDVASVVAELAHASQGKLGALEVSLVDERGAPVKTPAGAKIVISSRAGGALFAIRATNAGDALGGELPVGQYLASYQQGGGRAGRGAKQPVEVTLGGTARATLTVSGAGELAVQCRAIVASANALSAVAGPSPCKATIEALAGANPDFGPAHAAGPAKNQITTATGAASVPLAPGRYRVTLSRGPEFALHQAEVAIEDGKTASVDGLLRRVVDTSGYVATDFHQHTMLSVDAGVATRDRLIANAAEGVEIAVASEHNVVVDLQPLVRELGLEAFLVELAGDELTTDASRKPWGHANAFPLVADPAKPRGGALPVRDRAAKDVFEELRARAAPFVLQVNHPRTQRTGYFDQLRFDRATGTSADPDYDGGFDALEVWNGRNVDGREVVLSDFMSLLRHGHPVTPTADTDTHLIVTQEAGYPRTYVRVSDDANLASWDASRSTDLVRGVKTQRDVVLTNGPFLRVTANGAPIGGLAKGRTVEIKVHVECAPWVDVTTVAIVRARARAGEGARATPVRLRALPSGAMGADVSITLRVDADDAFVVQAFGEAPLTPVLSGDPKEIMPWAMSGAIWIDADGDGKSLGR